MQDILNAPKISNKSSFSHLLSDDNFNLINSNSNVHSLLNSPNVKILNVNNDGLNNFNLTFSDSDIETQQDSLMQNTIFSSILLCNDYLNMKKMQNWRLKINLNGSLQKRLR